MAHKIFVIIPANNEAQVIGACLESLANQTGESSVEVVVVANGCSDNTVAVASSWKSRFAEFGWSLHVLEIEPASKIAALNAGDRLADEHDRIYLDADVILSDNAVAEIAEIFSAEPKIGVCAPICFIEEPHSYVSRAYKAVWSKLPYFRDGVIGCGCYAVSGRGRTRWDAFPGLIADDKFVRLQFEAAERTTTKTSYFTIHLPEGFRELSNVRTRWSAGNRELLEMFPDLKAKDARRHGSSAKLLLSNPKLWLPGLVFIAIYIVAELRARKRWRLGTSVWERAESVRSYPRD